MQFASGRLRGSAMLDPPGCRGRSWLRPCRRRLPSDGCSLRQRTLEGASASIRLLDRPSRWASVQCCAREILLVPRPSAAFDRPRRPRRRLQGRLSPVSCAPSLRSSDVQPVSRSSPRLGEMRCCVEARGNQVSRPVCFGAARAPFLSLCCCTVNWACALGPFFTPLSPVFPVTRALPRVTCDDSEVAGGRHGAERWSREVRWR